MSDQARIWRVTEGDKLLEIEQAHLDLEARIQSWLEDDISILSPGLLVIGREVETDFGGYIDLLCIDEIGDLVVVELKRDKTPREITAQALDYGSWVAHLSNDRVMSIADVYHRESGFEEKFKATFGVDVPETLNQSHRLLVVASHIDASSERIIKYLSDSYGVNINAATFQYFTEANGGELLARVFLIEPEQVERSTVTHGSSKRRRNLTYEELAAIADDNGVGDLYARAVAGLERHLWRHTTRSSIGFTAALDDGQRRGTILSLLPGESDEERGLCFLAYSHRVAQVLGIEESAVRALLPQAGLEPWVYYAGAPDDYAGYQGFFATAEDIERLVAAFAS